MNQFKNLALLLIITIFLATPPAESQQNADVNEIVEKVDELFRSKSSQGRVEMEIITPHWERTLKMNIWTQGMDKTFIRITEPPKEKGVATLRIENEMWNYLPKTNKVIKVPPSMMMSSWMGSDFNNDDLVDEFSLLEDYSYKIINPDDAEPGFIYVKCVPKQGLPIVWGKVVFAVREEDYIPVIEKYYDEKGKLMRVMHFKEIKTFDNRTIPSVMELIPQNEEGKTVLRYLDLKFNINVDEDIFSLRNLRAGM
ncbi:outer membrane lipoprotein-sorting protein [candidate division KSB1 bacterium]|nr:outer membrane lipoprotein-sorting protein [candidate division KSB1 bacterium]